MEYEIILKKAAPFILAANLCACIGKIGPGNDLNVGGAGGRTDVGGNDSEGGAGGKDCIENNSGSVEGATTAHYEVVGNTVEDAVDDVFNPETGKGFWDEEAGRNFAGETNCHLEHGFYNFKFEGPTYNEKKECCYTASISGENPTICEATIYLPQWPGCDSCWDSMIKGLEEHEGDHADICKEVGEKLKEDTAAAAASACDKDCNTAMNKAADALAEKLDQLLTDAIKKYGVESDKLDKETNHGETQGAWYDPNCD